MRSIVTVYDANRQADDERRKTEAIRVQMKRAHQYLEAERIAMPAKAPTMLEIASAICESFGVTPAELVGPWRPRRFTQARIAGYVLARSLRKMSFPAIAKAFERADHKTIMAGLRVHEKHMCRPDYRQRFEVALSKLTSDTPQKGREGQK
jgi:chromosomal replication initiation ATPase DnaA